MGFNIISFYQLSLLTDISHLQPSEEQLREAREKAMLSKKMVEIIKEIIYHVIFLGLLVAVITGNQNVWTFRQNRALKDLFVGSDMGKVCAMCLSHPNIELRTQNNAQHKNGK